MNFLCAPASMKHSRTLALSSGVRARRRTSGLERRDDMGDLKAVQGTARESEVKTREDPMFN